MKRGTVAAPFAAIVSLVAAGSCCIPVGFFIAGAGLFGAAGFFGAAQPFLVALALVSLALGFIRTYAGARCTRRSRAAVVLLWTAAFLVLAMLLFPQVIAGFLADYLPAEVR